MGYDYLLTLFKVLLGLVTSRRLIYIALISFGLYLLWVILALVFSFQRRFYTKSLKMYNFLKKSDNLADKRNFIDGCAARLSVGFGNGWQRFCRAGRGKPSKYISRKDSLDSEVNGGVFNQGKSIMRFYIWLTTILLLIFNLAYHGGESVVTFTLFAECAMFPVIYFVILKIFYFLYTIVRQQLYKLDIESFYDLVTELDNNFGTDEPTITVPVAVNYAQTNEAPSEESSDEPVAEEEPEISQIESVQETSEEEVIPQEEEQSEESEPVAEENELDKYDVFKKKNIDVSSLINEVPSSSKTLPFINVDSNYVIGDEGGNTKSETTSETYGETESEAEPDLEQPETIAETENAEPIVEPEQTEETQVELNEESVAPEAEETVSNAEESEEVPAETTELNDETVSAENSFAELNAEQVENIDVTENTLESAAEPEQEENSVDEAGEKPSEAHEENIQTPDESEKSETESAPKLKPIIHDSTTLNLDDFEINTADEVAEKAKQNEVKSNFVLPGEREEMENGTKIERRRPHKENTETAETEIIETQTEEVQPKITKREPKKHNAEKETKPQPKPEKKVKAEKKPEKKQENSVKKEIKENNMAELNDKSAKRRGRPKKQIFDENVSITSDEEFDEVLSRAEKLMRKSEEGLSSSQSKRIEKELKMLIDAMNKYKENK